jgi:hypothetical protein
MKLDHFFHGLEFMCGGSRWRCTDVGSRVVVAIKIDEHDDDKSWLSGPPYAVNEEVFDECGLEGCEPCS